MARKDQLTATVYLRPHLHVKLKEFARQNEITTSQVLVKAVEKLLTPNANTSGTKK